jgi:two-component system, sensor histidine kinase and response regulator
MMPAEITLSSRQTAELRHTLRTPINHIIGYSELLLEDSNVPDASQQNLSHVLSCAQQILALVQRHLQGGEQDAAPVSLTNLRTDLEQPLSTLIRATDVLSRTETGSRLHDVERIRCAAGELASFSSTEISRTGSAQTINQTVVPEALARIAARILIVDDSELSREMLCRILERQGHVCVAVASGAEALERLRADRFDVVLLDFMMEGMNGIDVLRTVKADPDLRENAIVMLSAFDEVADIGHSLEIGAEDYLLKPFDRIVLTARLNAVLERKRLRNLERCRTSQLEIAQNELRRSNEDLQRFASVVSHDLQEPLRMVTSYMQLLERSLGADIKGEQREYLEFAIDGGRRMSELIRDLLSYSNVSSSEARCETVDLQEIVKQVKVHLRAVIEEANAQIISTGLPKLTADHSQLMQIFQNLIGNALKYRSDRPPIIHVRAMEQTTQWLISVSDNGLGIDRENCQRIFEMFRRLHDRSIPGTGIGLAICQRVVERWGGKIWVESETGQGSTFFFTIPR